MSVYRYCLATALVVVSRPAASQADDMMTPSQGVVAPPPLVGEALQALLTQAKFDQSTVVDMAIRLRNDVAQPTLTPEAGAMSTADARELKADSSVALYRSTENIMRAASVSAAARQQDRHRKLNMFRRQQESHRRCLCGLCDHVAESWGLDAGAQG